MLGNVNKVETGAERQPLREEEHVYVRICPTFLAITDNRWPKQEKGRVLDSPHTIPRREFCIADRVCWEACDIKFTSSPQEEEDDAFIATASPSSDPSIPPGQGFRVNNGGSPHSWLDRWACPTAGGFNSPCYWVPLDGGCKPATHNDVSKLYQTPRALGHRFSLVDYLPTRNIHPVPGRGTQDTQRCG